MLIGDGDYQPGDGLYDGNQLSALTSYNERTAQVDTDLQALAADGASATAIASEVTEYRSTTDAAIGFYGRATTQMQDTVLPAAAQLRDQTAAEATQAASDAHGWAIAGLIGTLVLGVLAVVALVAAQRRFSSMFRRKLNPALLAATDSGVSCVRPGDEPRPLRAEHIAEVGNCTRDFL